MKILGGFLGCVVAVCVPDDSEARGSLFCYPRNRGLSNDEMMKKLHKPKEDRAFALAGVNG